MISVEDCEFIKKFEVANSEEKQIILTNEGHQVSILLIYIFFLFIGCLVIPDLHIVSGLLPNESRHIDQCVIFIFFFHCHSAFSCLFFLFFFVFFSVQRRS